MGVSIGTESLERYVRGTINAIQLWLSTRKSFSCGSDADDSFCKQSNACYTSTKKRTSSGVVNRVGSEDSKYNDALPFFSAVRCSGQELSSAIGGENLRCIVLSEDCSMSEEDDQMRRLASWETFGTAATNDSLDLNVEEMVVDDDGNPINPKLLEKARQKREKFHLGTSKKRVVQFAYPPISSLRQCPRIDPEEVDLLFFSEEELETYENDRRLAGTIDDVEIVAVSTSFSDEIHLLPQSGMAQLPSNSTSPSKKLGLPKFLTTPRIRKASPDFQESQRCEEQQDLKFRRKGTLASSKTVSASDENSSHPHTETDESEQPKEKRLLKSVQIFLRARSTA